MAKKKKQSSAPSGLSAERVKDNFKFTWKNPSKGYGDSVRYKWAITQITASGKKYDYSKHWSDPINLGKNATSKTLTQFDHEKLYPYVQKKTVNGKKVKSYYAKMTRVALAVQGCTKDDSDYNYTMSKWTTKNGVHKILVPNKPSVSFVRSTGWTSTVNINPHYVSGGHSKNGIRWVTQIQYDVYLRYKLYNSKTEKWEWQDSYKTFFSKVDKKNSIHRQKISDSTKNTDYGAIIEVTKDKVYSFTINRGDESSSIENSHGATEWVRVRCCGPAGNSPWVYKHFAYYGPDPAIDLEPRLVGGFVDNKGVYKNDLQCTVKFKYKHLENYPIDYMTVQYAFATPEIEGEGEDEVITPGEDAEWKTAEIGGNGTLKPDGYGVEKNNYYQTMSVDFKIHQSMPTGKALFCKVLTYHDGNEVESDEVPFTWASTGNLVNQNNSLEMPDITSVEIGGGSPDPEEPNNFITVNVVNHAVSDNVSLCVQFIPKTGIEGFESEYINVTETDPLETEYSIVCRIPPDYDMTKGFGVGVFAFMGSYTSDDKEEYTVYTVNVKARSKIRLYGGSIPLPPSDCKAEHLGDGNVLVTWKWTWNKADYAEVGWSDYSEAIYSTEQPSVFNVPTSQPSKLIVRDLDLGVIWYFWVRLVKGNNASVWAETDPLSLTSSPNIPSLILSKDFITENETVTASWVYVSTDNTPQGSAKICLCSENFDGEIEDDDDESIIARIPNSDQPDPQTQHVVLDPKVLGWTAGNSYNISVKVTSERGISSEEWSQIETIHIVEPIHSRIISTSMSPNVELYNSNSTYLLGDYVLKDDNYVDDDGEELDYISTVTLYKANSNINTPEEWNPDHWDTDTDKPYLELHNLPLTVTADCSGTGISSSLRIERSSDYFVDRPDEGVYGGYEGEIVYESTSDTASIYNTFVNAVFTYFKTEDEEPVEGKTYYEIINNLYYPVQNPDPAEMETYYEVDGFDNCYEYDSLEEEYVQTEDTAVDPQKTYFINGPSSVTFTITQSDLSGYLDDDATYYLIYRIDDEYGQYSEMWYEFTVKWDHQAILPSADMVIENAVLGSGSGGATQGIAKITVNWPSDSSYVAEGDCCDIYRFSANGIYPLYIGASFGETYVDPYPTIGDHGGYRVVYRTLYGDYITAEKTPAWIDLNEENGNDIFKSEGNIIDFGYDTITLMFNLDINNNWSKDFKQTKYLGGSVQGDWNYGIGMTTSISTNVLSADAYMVSTLRRLAQYLGACHVRTLDGMNYIADIQVSEHVPYAAYYEPSGELTNLGDYSLSITKIDSSDLDGMTLQDWLDSISDEEIPPDNP